MWFKKRKRQQVAVDDRALSFDVKYVKAWFFNECIVTDWKATDKQTDRQTDIHKLSFYARNPIEWYITQGVAHGKNM